MVNLRNTGVLVLVVLLALVGGAMATEQSPVHAAGQLEESDAAPDDTTPTITLSVDPTSLTASLPLERTAGSPWAVSPVLSTQAIMVGIGWEDDTPIRMQVRNRNAGLVWSDWTDTEQIDSAPDGAAPPRSSEPVWVGVESIAIQVRVQGALEGVSIALIEDARSTAIDAESQDTSPTLEPATQSFTTDNGLDVHRRGEWNTEGCRADGAKVGHAQVEVAIVHHTAASNSYTAADVPAIIRSHCAYHVYSLGWDDIGYNFLIDRFGGVWEGRKGGAEFPVRGAHSMGFNSASAGFALMGNHATEQPTATALSSLQKIIGWKLWIEGVPATGTVVVESLGSYKWPEGTLVTLNRIAGHRDVQSTTCPGDLAYDDLAAIRSGAAAELAALGERPGVVATEFATWDNDDQFLIWQEPEITGGLDIRVLGLEWDLAATPDVDGDGDSELLLYRRSDGFAKLHELTPAGRLGMKIRTYEWDTKIEIIATPDADGDGDDELLVYRDNGSATMYELMAGGNRGPVLRHYYWPTNYKFIATPDRDGDGDDELFTYDTTSFSVMYELLADGRRGQVVRTYPNLASNWNGVAAFDDDGDGDDEMIVYRDGTSVVRELNVGGRLGEARSHPLLPLDRDLVLGVVL